jgi:hypothetical protein
VLIGVSYLYPAPDRKKLAGLTFATVDEKLETFGVDAPVLAKETPWERKLNLAFTLLLLLTVVSLWVHFR